MKMLCCLVCLFSICLQPLLTLGQTSVQERSVGVRVKKTNANGTTQEVQLYDGSYALVIGNSEYSFGWERLSGVKADVVAVRNVLERHGFKVEVEENLTSERFEQRVKKFINDYGYERNNRLIIYYAGHGYTLNSAGDRRELGYIIPSDTPLPTKDERGFRQKAVSMYAIQTFAKEIQAKHALFVFDSCFSGKLFALRATLKLTPFIVDKVDNPVRQFITAGDETQTVPDESIFRKAFVRGLEGDADRNKDGYIVVTELADYLKEAVTNYSNRRQTPQYGTINDIDLDRGDVVFVVPKGVSETGRNPLTTKETTFWRNIENSTKLSDFEDYLERCEKGEFVCDYKAPAELKVYQLREIKASAAWLNFSLIAKKLIQYDSVFEISFGILANPEGALIAVESKNKTGFMDKTGKLMIPAKYDVIEDGRWEYGDFSNGYSEVRLNKKWGVIDKTGRVVIPFEYDYVFGLEADGLIRVRLNDKYGVIDNKNKLIIPIKYDDVHSFSEGLAAAKLNNKWGFISQTGADIIPFKYDDVEYEFSGDLVGVKFKDKWGFIARDGKVRIPFKYDSIEGYEDGLFKVKLSGKYGYIDKTGREIIPIKYDGIGNFAEDLLRVKSNEKWGYINKSGQETIPFKYDFAKDFSEGLAVIKLNGKYGYIDKTGEIAIPCKYDDVVKFADVDSFSGGIAVVKLNGKFGIIDRKGKELTPFKYDDVSRGYEHLVTVEINDKTGFVDKKGREIISPEKYDSIWCHAFIEEGFFGVKLNSKRGFVDIYGNEYFDF